MAQTEAPNAEVDDERSESELRPPSASAAPLREAPLREAHSRWVGEVAVSSGGGLREEVAALAESVAREAESSHHPENKEKDSALDALIQIPEVGEMALRPDRR